MGNLSNLYISQSYQSLIHLGNDSFVSSSLVGLQDGLGNSIGVAVNSAGDLSISGSLTSSLQQGYVWVGNANGRTTTVPTSSFGGGGTGSATWPVSGTPSGIVSGSSQITALGFVSSSVTGSSLITGSVVGNVLTFTKGDASQFSLTVATGSGGGTINTGSFATTGSNNFNGNQTITGSLSVSGSEYINGGNKLYIQRDTQGAQQFLRLGATDNTFNFAFIVTGSDSNPGQQVWGINTAGGVWGNSFDAGVVFNNYVTASFGLRVQNGGTFSAPLQQGNVWVGDANGRNMIVPTSSFAGAVPVGTATTGSNTFNGNQTINGEVRAQGATPYFTAAGNSANSGAQFPTHDVIITNNNNEFGGFGIYKEGNYPNTTYTGLVATAYSPQYGGTTVPMIIANGNNPGGNDSAIIWKSDGTAEHWKKSDFKYGINVTGSTELQGFTSSLQQGYVFVGGANGRTTTVATSSFSGGSTDITALNAFTASQNTKNSTLATYTGSNDTKWNTLGGLTGSYATTGSNRFNGNQIITGSLTLSSSAAIELNVIGNSSFTGSTIISGSFSALVPTASNESQINIVDLPTFTAANGTTYPYAGFSLQDYASSGIDQTFAIEYANASFEKYSALLVGPSRTQFIVGKGSGFDFDVIELLDNNNNTSTAKVKADTVILQGPTQLTGSLNVSGSLTSSLQQGYVLVGNASGRTIAVATSSLASTTDLTSLNAFTASQNTKNSTLATYTGSNDTKWNTLGGQTGSYVTSAITASSLVTASFSGNTLTFTKGDSSTFGVIIPDVSGSTINTGSLMVTGSVVGNVLTFTKGDASQFSLTVATGSGGGGSDLTSLNAFTASQEVLNATFATTGSNAFRGNQTISGSLTLSSSAAIELNVIGGSSFTGSLTTFGNVTLTNGNLELLASNSYIKANNLTGSWGQTNGTAALQINGGLDVNGSLYISGSLTSSLQQGYVLVGNASGRTISVPTSSFVGAVPVGTATTGSNTFNGNQTITGSSRPVGVTIQESGVSGGDGIGRYFIGTNSNGTGTLVISSSLNDRYLEFNQDNGWIEVYAGQTNFNNNVKLLSRTDIRNTFVEPNYQLYLPTGSNQQAGTAVLDGGNPGTVTVSNSLVTANSIIMLTKQTLTNSHMVAVSSKGSGTFTITSNGNGDADTVGWVIINNS